MAYCKKCGRRLSADSNFCPECGTPVFEDQGLEISVETENDADEAPERRQVFVGLIRKCPNCGAELPSGAAICPQCGFELNTTRGAHALEEFAQQLDEIDREISADTIQKARGWSNWSGWKRFGWVVLNIYTFALPIIIPKLLRYFRILIVKPSPKLTALEKRKADLIENYLIPNEKEALIESLRFIRTKVESIDVQNKDERLMYWMNLWKVKAGQIYSKARTSLNNNAEVEGQYSAIEKKVKRTNTGMRISAGLKFAIIAAIVYLVVSFYVGIFTGSSLQRDRPVLGLSLVDVTEEQAEEYALSDGAGVYIAEVTGKNAKKAGFQPRDKIVKFDFFDMKDTYTASTILNHLQYKHTGDTIVVTVVRNGQQMAIETVLEKRKK